MTSQHPAGASSHGGSMGSLSALDGDASLSHSKSGYSLRIPIYENENMHGKVTVTWCKVL